MSLHELIKIGSELIAQSYCHEDKALKGQKVTQPPTLLLRSLSA